MIDKKQLLKEFNSNRKRYVKEWSELLRFPTISADPSRNRDCKECAGWLMKQLKSAGFKSRIIPTSGKPLVFGEFNGGSKEPTVLYYAHYDVQPTDPEDEWNTSPFEPTLINGRMYARGASDDKGQLFSSIKAMETLIKLGKVKRRVKVILEGEEESGSGGINKFIRANSRLCKADILMATDTAMSPSGAPAIVMGLRGVIMLTAELTGPRNDLHSGSHGGTAPNVALQMARLISTLHHQDGRVAVKGFYDTVKPPSKRERTAANSAPLNAGKYKTETGVPPVGGEKRFTPIERLGFRPTIEINGLHSGYGGKGGKTIIPAKAVAKITARLVPDQDPAKTMKAIIKHLENHAPQGLKLTISETGIGGPGFRLNINSEIARKTAKILKGLTNKKTVFTWDGASIPVLTELSQRAGAELLISGFGKQIDNIHAPNESFSMEQFKLGYLYMGLSLTSL